MSAQRSEQSPSASANPGKSIPKDAQVITAILKEFGITEYDRSCSVSGNWAVNLLEDCVVAVVIRIYTYCTVRTPRSEWLKYFVIIFHGTRYI